MHLYAALFDAGRGEEDEDEEDGGGLGGGIGGGLGGGLGGGTIVLSANPLPRHQRGRRQKHKT